MTTALLLVAAGCGRTESGEPAPEASSTPQQSTSAPLGEPQLSALGEYRDWSPAVRVRVTSEGVSGDERGPWLAVSVRVRNSTAKAQPVPEIELSCDARDAGARIDTGTPVPTSVGAHGTVDFALRLPLSGDQRSGAPVPACVGAASIDMWQPHARGGGTFGRGWEVPADVVAQLNAARPNAGPPPPGPATDPDRPYAWVDRYSSGYQVVVVPGLTADEAIRVLDPVRGSADPDDAERVVVVERPEGVVLFTFSMVPDRLVRALSRRGRLAASYSNTVEGDDRILVARNGKAIRSYDPYADESFDGSKPLPQEEGLDFENDTGPASWSLLERLSGIAITEDWLLDDSHPGFRLRD